MEAAASDKWIPNLVLGQDYDLRYADAPIHYDALENLAGFFGRKMAVHRHAQYLQIHYIDRGEIQFQIDDKIYQLTGPALVLTPPSVPHSFFSAKEAQGHVLTIHQSIIWQILKAGLAGQLGSRLDSEICLASNKLNEEELVHWQQLKQTLNSIKLEWLADNPAKNLSLETLVQLLLIQLTRLQEKDTLSTSLNNGDLQFFRRFSKLIQENFTQQWALSDYTKELGISASRLHLICQRIANKPPKRIIHDWVIQEAKRLLTFTNLSSSEVCYQLGFTDPAYFSRFFKRLTGLTAQNFRHQVSKA